MGVCGRRARPMIEDVECRCSTCQDMCRHHPCTSTPDDVERLIEAGFVHQLSEDRFEVEVPALEGHPELGNRWKVIRAILPAVKGYEYESGPNPHHGECVFFEHGLCVLHESSLKPTGGKKASCQRTMVGSGYSIHRELIESWDTEQGRALVRRFVGEICDLWEQTSELGHPPSLVSDQPK